MKTVSFSILLVLLMLSACSPAVARPAVVPILATISVPQPAQECIVTPHEYQAQAIPIPVALAVNLPGEKPAIPVQGVSLFWRDGAPLGVWPTGQPFPSTRIHVASSIPDGIETAPLVFLGSSEDGIASLKVSLGGQVSTLIDFPRTVTVTELMGIPGRPFIAYSTLEPSTDGSILRSQIVLGEYQSIATAESVLMTESTESRYALPVAIHRDATEVPDGLWYTYGLWGIGGDSLTDPRSGLYYLDLSTGESLEFLGMGCQFSSLSIGQSWAAWTSAEGMHATNLHTGTTTAYPFLPGMDRTAHAFISPGEGLVGWLEGEGWEYDGTLETTLRFVTTEGAIMAGYPVSAFAGPSGLGEEIAILPLGWLMPDNEVLLVAVYSAATEQAVLVYVDINSQVISPLVNGVFAGFAYP